MQTADELVAPRILSERRRALVRLRTLTVNRQHLASPLPVGSGKLTAAKAGELLARARPRNILAKTRRQLAVVPFAPTSPGTRARIGSGMTSPQTAAREALLAAAPSSLGGDASHVQVKIASIGLDGGRVIDLSGAAVTAVVGGNNVGKSTLLRSLHTDLMREYYQTPTGLRLYESLKLDVNGDYVDLGEWLVQNATFTRSGANDASFIAPNGTDLLCIPSASSCQAGGSRHGTATRLAAPCPASSSRTRTPPLGLRRLHRHQREMMRGRQPYIPCMSWRKTRPSRRS